MARDDISETIRAVQRPPEALIIPVDCRDGMRLCLAPGSVHCVVLSPPYFGLRNYDSPSQWEGGDPACTHGHAWIGATAGNLVDDYTRRHVVAADEAKSLARTGGECRCGAVLVDRQIGQERTPEEYVESLVLVFREIWRVLRDDGTVWLNLGDSYARPIKKGGSGRGGKNERYLGDNYGRARVDVPPGLKEKDLIGIPWRVAFALQADGWYLRQEIIWSKPNPMPESVTDRCTKAHEQIFLLTKSDRYFFDAEAIMEPSIYAPDKTTEVERARGYYNGKWSTPGNGQRQDGAFKAIRPFRNKRSVWTVPPRPFKGAHFATFPPDLIEPCIMAGTSERGVCSACGAPWERLKVKGQISRIWTPGCDCGAGTVPATVLDPFGGAGTTALVSRRLGRSSVSFDLSAKYCAMTEERLQAAQA